MVNSKFTESRARYDSLLTIILTMNFNFKHNADKLQNFLYMKINIADG